MALRTLPKTDLLPHALYRAAQVRELDRVAIGQFGIPGETLMERAGCAAYSLLRERWPAARDITVLAGIGNNAGDGFVLARLAHNDGLRVRVLQLGDRDRLAGDAALNAARWRDLGGSWEDADKLPAGTDLIVDGIFGTGLEREVRGSWAEIIAAANAHRAPSLALDIPSGLHADTGVSMGSAIRAAATVTFIGLKQGMFTADGPACCGEMRFDGLEVPARVYASQILSARRVDWAGQADGFAPRPRTAHKGHFGHVLVVGGDQGYGGAARMAAEAALRCGAGLVSVATRAGHVPAMLAGRPEIMAHAADHAAALDGLLRQAGVVVLGPGLGRRNWGRELWQSVLGSGRPLVVDADGLNLLAEQPQKRDDWVLTPHPGEAARLLGVCVAEVQEDRFAAAAALQLRYGGVCVLKGPGTLVVEGGRRPPAVCVQGNPGMASGGMGDVLAGLVGGLLAQGHAAGDAATSAVCLHAAAADCAAAGEGERGMLASDLLPHVRRLVNPA